MIKHNEHTTKFDGICKDKMLNEKILFKNNISKLITIT